MLIMSRLLSIILRLHSLLALYSAQNIGKEIVDWLVEHEERTNEKPSNSSHIPEGAQTLEEV